MKLTRRPQGRPRLRKLRDQTIVITGASSGIGLTTAKMAAAKGARVVLNARNEHDLRAAVDQIRALGGRASYVVGDVAEEQAMLQLAETAVREFGGFDTWVNNAGVSIYGRLVDVPLQDKRRLFDVNFWGVVNGCRAALPHLRERGGVIVNIGSIVSDRAIPLQGIYSASKHAVKGYTEALRMELEQDGAPVTVTLVKPASIDTMYVRHARNYMPFEPTLPPPVYAPDEVARAILTCAERPVREVVVGAGGRALTLMGSLAPRLTDLYMERAFFWQQQRAGRPNIDREGNLYAPARNGREREPHRGYVAGSSAYTRAALSDAGRALPWLAAGLILLGGASLGLRSAGHEPPDGSHRVGM
jgi:NAD(P)-dependent dehydrogenase (short-subunit alcohol dehydrogenase family)